MDKVLYYVDYVLKQDSGVNYLRSGALYLSFWPRHVVDVASILVLITMIPVGLFATLIQIILRKTHERKLKNTINTGKAAANGKMVGKAVQKKKN